jgi:3-methyladenine DNA glycosylase AlkD
MNKPAPTYIDIIKKLRSLSNPKNVAGMAKYGINPKNTLGVNIPTIRKMGKLIGQHHALALKLWASGIHEARLLASLVDEPAKVTEKQIEQWVKDFDSWDICDQVVHLFEATPYAYKKCWQWAKRKEEYVKRAAFALMAVLVVHDKKAPDSIFVKFLPVIKNASTDERNFVKKAVNWTLRNIGKRNEHLNRIAIKTAEQIRKIDSKTARWIAADALRELKSAAVQKKISTPRRP